MCESIFVLLANVFSQNAHVNGFSPKGRMLDNIQLPYRTMCRPTTQSNNIYDAKVMWQISCNTQSFSHLHLARLYSESDHVLETVSDTSVQDTKSQPIFGLKMKNCSLKTSYFITCVDSDMALKMEFLVELFLTLLTLKQSLLRLVHFIVNLTHMSDHSTTSLKRQSTSHTVM